MTTQTASAASPASFATASRLAAARAGDQHEFSNLVEPSRRELQVHCYRMLGSLFEAEDAVQETFLRAWRRLDTFQRDVSFRAWLYKIATNVCLDMLDKRRARRRLPVGGSAPSDPLLPMPAPLTEPVWLEPVPDDWLAGVEQSSNPEARQAARDNIRLAFVAALQRLPPRQRAVLILRDVLDWSASEAAELFGLTPSAVTSALHRARVKLAQNEVAGMGSAAPAPLDPLRRQLLARYVTAWESADVAGLVQLLKEEATFSMPPWSVWYQGREAIRQFFLADVFSDATPGQARLLPVHANGGPGFGLYHAQPGGSVYRGFAIQALRVDARTGQIADIVNFINPALFAAFGLPAEIS